MTAAAFLTVGNVHVVPALQNRLAFAIAVRRALAELRAIRPWTARDLVAIALPPSILDSVRSGISRLPHVSLVFARVENESGREVVAVTPCDAMIEALRTADENGWPVECVDLEVSPGNLQRGGCLRDPEWPDDMLALALGVERYLEMIEGYFAQPPMRLEPLDTLRERHIVERVRNFQPFYDRILLVCDAGLTRSVLAGIAQPHSKTTPTEALASKIVFSTVEQLNLEVLLSYLDDYPKIVERYNRERLSWIQGEDLVENFDKFDALMDAVLESARLAIDLKISTRQHQTFAVFLKNILRHERRMIPTSDVLFYAARSCFSRGFSERLHSYLSEYEKQISVERVRPAGTAERTAFRYKIDVDASAAGYTSRACQPTPPRYTVTRIAQKSQRGQSDHDVAYHWLPEQHFLYRMHQRIRTAVARQDRQRRRSRVYRGSIEMGVDVRATMRSAYGKSPRLYVKSNAPMRHPAYTRNEPVVWIVDAHYKGQACFHADHIERRTESIWKLGGSGIPAFPIGVIDAFQPWEHSQFNDVYDILTYNRDQTGRVLYARRCGWINFGWDFEDEDDAKATLGDAFERRFPNHETYHDPRDEGRMLGCIDPEFRDLQSEGGPWQEIALMTALKYAQSSIVVGAPAGFVVPALSAAYAARLGKAIHVVKTDFLSRSDLEKFRAHYLYHSPGGRDLAGETNFEILMRGFWE